MAAHVGSFFDPTLLGNMSGRGRFASLLLLAISCILFTTMLLMLEARMAIEETRRTGRAKMKKE